MFLRRPAARVAPRRLVALALTLSAVIGFASPARAQSINIVNQASLPRLDKDGKPVQKRPQTLTPEGVSFQDCIDDQQILFTLQMAGFEANAVIEAWASIGQDCKAPTARGGGVTTCWKVSETIPLATVADVRIPVRKIMAGAPPNNALSLKADESVCGKVNLANVSVQFLYFPPGQGGATASMDKSVTVIVDTVGPLPPSGLRALPGDTRIKVEWTNISGGSADGGATGGLTELTGIKVYCDPVSAQTTTTAAEPICHDEPIDAGPDADASVDAGTVEVCEDGGTSTSTSTECGSANFVNPDGSKVIPTAEFNSKYECGSITGNTGTSATASAVGKTPLVNGTTYAIAVAATDRFGNVGELSSVVCETPEVTTDFWDDYRKAGGRAGDGCATAGGGAPLASTAVLGVGVTLALSSIFRFRRRRNGAPDKRSQNEGSRR